MQSTDQLWPEEKQTLESWEQKGQAAPKEVRQLHKPHALYLNGETVSKNSTQSNVKEEYLCSIFEM